MDEGNGLGTANTPRLLKDKMTTQVKVIRRKKSDTNAEAGYAVTHKAHLARLAKLDAKSVNQSRCERIAKDFQFTKSYHVPKLKELYPSQPWRWKVDYFYPNAEGGALYIDEPVSLFDEAELTEKKRFLRALGFRYVILGPGRSYEQDLMELEQCGQQPPQQ